MPSRKLTEAFIQALEYEGPNVIWWDERTKGLGIQVLKTRKSWVIQHDVRPRKTFAQYGGLDSKSLADARTEAMGFMSKLRKKVDPWAASPSEVASGMTFGALFEEWKGAIGERTGKPKRDATIRDASNCFRFALDEWMARPWQSISVADCRKKYDAIQKGAIDAGEKTIGTRSRAIQTMAYLKAVISYGLKTYDVKQGNPVSGLSAAWMRPPKVDKKKPPHRRLEAAELKKLGKALARPKDPEKKKPGDGWQHENKLVPEFVRLAFYTGLRITELSQLRYDMLTDTHIVVPGTATKNHQELEIPITRPIAACIKRLRALPHEGEQEWLFSAGTTVGHLTDPGWPCELARRESKVNFTGHDARYTFAALGEELGFNVRVVASLLNQMSTVKSSITHTYQPISEDARKTAIVKINAVLQKHLK